MSKKTSKKLNEQKEIKGCELDRGSENQQESDSGWELECGGEHQQENSQDPTTVSPGMEDQKMRSGGANRKSSSSESSSDGNSMGRQQWRPHMTDE